MSISMHQACVPVFVNTLGNLSAVLDKACIGKVLDFLGTRKPAPLDGSEEREAALKVGAATLAFKGQAHLMHFALPNFFFHVTTAYGILRHNGVGLGKRDYIGQV